MPLLSVIIPVYNTSEYLVECLDSVIGQTYENLEIICVNDGSTDNSDDLLQIYSQRDPRIQIINQENSGLSVARNTGLAQAHGKYVTFVDSDDFIEIDAYQRVIPLLEKDDSVDFVCFEASSFGEMSPNIEQSDKEYYSLPIQGKHILTEHLMLSTDVSAWNKIYRKELIDRHHIQFPPNLKYEDAYFFNLYALNSSVVYYLKEKLYHYRRHAKSIMAQTFNAKRGYSIDHLSIGIKIFDYLQTHNRFLAHRHYFGKIFLSYLHFALRHASDKRERQEIYNKANKFLTQEGINFNDSDELLYEYYKIKQHLLLGEKHTFCFGLVKKKGKNLFSKTTLLGLPLWRVRYRNHEAQHYLCNIFQVRREKLSTQFLSPALISAPELTTLNIDNTQLLKSLSLAEPFTYIPNPGNIGDVLIASATLHFFDEHNIQYKMFNGDYSGTVVYGGGGALVPYYPKHWQSILKNAHLSDKIIILPSSVNNIPEFTSQIDSKFTIFTRDKTSYNYLISEGTDAEVYLDHDMALRANNSLLHTESTIGVHEVNALHLLYNKLKNTPSHGYLLRQDIESINHHPSDLDLSECFWLDANSTKDWIHFGAKMMLAAVDSFNAITTDRLHVGIAAMLLNKKLSLINNSYGKIFDIHAHSFPHRETIQLHNQILHPTEHSSDKRDFSLIEQLVQNVRTM